MKYSERKISQFIFPLGAVKQIEKPVINDLLRRAHMMKFFSHICLNFSFNSFLSTVKTCMQLLNVNEIFQPAINNVF